MLVLILKKNNKIREFVENSTCFVLALITSVQFFFFAAGKKKRLTKLILNISLH